MKYKFLESLSTDSDLISIWSITWNNISLTNPYQSKYLKIFLEQINKISGTSSIWRYIDVFVQNMNLGNINVTGPDVIQLLVEYSISVFDKKNVDDLPIKTTKRKILESLLKIQLTGDDSLLCFTFDVVEKVMNKSNDRGDIMRSFARLFFSVIDTSTMIKYHRFLLGFHIRNMVLQCFWIKIIKLHRLRMHRFGSKLLFIGLRRIIKENMC